MMSSSPSKRRLVVAITGASGALYAYRLVQLVVAAGIETHLVVSPLGQRLLHDELGLEGLTPSGLASLAGQEGEQDKPDNLILHNFRDVGATIASGSFRHDGMIVVPCSSNSLGAIASGVGQNLVHRAAHVTLKERRRLVLVHREMPLSLIDIRNMQTVTEAGAIVCPAQPGFYMLPETIADLIDFVVGRVLDLVEVDHDLNIRWSEKVLRKGASGRASQPER
jgi:polyprenyl P-hydroxybenzoate/phenylacrylic acid decarboxylase-like protein